MDRRQRQRTVRRLTCEVRIGDRRTPGLVCNISDFGLFVETTASPNVERVVMLRFPESPERPELCFEAGVARMSESPPHLQCARQSGIGVEIFPPRQAFERWIANPFRSAPRTVATEGFSLAPLGNRMKSGTGKYRVRLVRQDRPGTQILTLRSDSEESARALALSRLGGIWRVAESRAL